MADAVCKIIDLQDEIASDMDRLVQIKKDIVDVIGGVEDVELRILLEQRYLCGATWEEITMNLRRRLTEFSGACKLICA